MTATSLSPLPIDDQLPAVLAQLRGAGARSVLVEAPPGAGKTTRLPYALLGEDWCQGTVLVTEPRRIAARLAATYVAAEQNERLGDLVGYRVRFDDKTSAKTRLCYMTEGLLLQRLLNKNGFSGVSAIVLDEVHERSADLDVLLALLKLHLQTNTDLRVVLMSATLDAAPLAAHFSAPSIQSEGRSYEVTVTHAQKEDERPLPIQIRSEVRAAMERPGDILVFLPGAFEIRSAGEALNALSDVDVLELHGDLPVDQQARVMRPGPRRRIILSTNVAESSVTIPGVTTVIDSGLAKTAIFDHWSGVTRLEVQPISQARCIQRAGRAGRVAPGHAVRLFTRGSFLARPLQDAPEIQRGDLSGAYLSLVSAGLNPEELPWLSRPSDEAWNKSRALLERLGAVDALGLTPIGRAMAQLPLPTRLARVVVAGFQNSIDEDACLAAALLAERDILIRSRTRRSEHEDVTFGDSDLDERMDRLRQLESDRFDRRLARDLEIDVTGAKRVAESARSLKRSLQRCCAGLERRAPDHPLTRSLLSGFLDRVAERRPPGRDLVLENGTQATLAQSSCVVAPLLLALSADAPGGRLRKAAVRVACRLEPDLLLDQLGDQITAVEETVFHAEKERVEQISRLLYGKITLDETRSLARPSGEATQVLVDAALSKGRKTFDPDDELETLYVRLQLLFEHRKDAFDTCTEEELAPLMSWGALGEQGPQEEGLIRAALAAAAATRTTLAELRAAPLADELHHHLPHSLTECLRQLVPLETTLRGGRRLRVHYKKGRAPWIESRLQDFFGMSEGPTLLKGKLPLQIHFLAPNQRALQVTTDLPGFWERHYPDLRKQLMRKYPKHLWPEDGKTASPPTPGKIR